MSRQGYPFLILGSVVLLYSAVVTAIHNPAPIDLNAAVVMIMGLQAVMAGSIILILGKRDA